MAQDLGVPCTRHVVAVDVGGTETKAALVGITDSGEAVVLDRRRRPTPRPEDGDTAATGVIDLVVTLVDELRADPQLAGNHPDGIGVVVPGIVDEERGVGVMSANLGWRNVPFRELIGTRTGLPVAFGHDVRAGGLAEFRLGAARGLTDAVFLPIGTGIAGALILGGRLHGGGGYAGEIGHVDVGHGEPCRCGQRGCLEHVASSAAVARRYTARTGRPVAGAAEVAAAVREGDRDAVAVWDEAVRSLARGILLLATVLAPEAVVLGGGLALAGDLLTRPLAEHLDRLVSFQRRPELRLAQLGDQAGCLGAALLAADLTATAGPAKAG
ncbi:MAG TPA: ROK family protein [Pseudonocardiaceae bacterium]